MRPALSWCAGPAALAGLPPPAPARAASSTLPPGIVWLALARRALATGAYEEALRCFDGALVHSPREALAHLGRAACLSSLGRDEQAADALRATFECASGQEHVLYQLARLCAREGHGAFAMPLLAEALRARPALAATARADPLFADHPAFFALIDVA